eukprot:scaffold1112_cov116-Isochrysis_galbana.AAC.31
MVAAANTPTLRSCSKHAALSSTQGNLSWLDLMQRTYKRDPVSNLATSSESELRNCSLTDGGRNLNDWLRAAVEYQPHSASAQREKPCRGRASAAPVPDDGRYREATGWWPWPAARAGLERATLCFYGRSPQLGRPPHPRSVRWRTTATSRSLARSSRRTFVGLAPQSAHAATGVGPCRPCGPLQIATCRRWPTKWHPLAGHMGPSRPTRRRPSRRRPPSDTLRAPAQSHAR